MSTDIGATWEFLEMLQEIIDEGASLPKQDFNVDEIGLYQKRIPDWSYIPKEEKLMPDHKTANYRLTQLFGGNISCEMKLSLF